VKLITKNFPIYSDQFLKGVRHLKESFLLLLQRQFDGNVACELWVLFGSVACELWVLFGSVACELWVLFGSVACELWVLFGNVVVRIVGIAE
jgi:hypothetical protein